MKALPMTLGDLYRHRVGEGGIIELVYVRDLPPSTNTACKMVSVYRVHLQNTHAMYNINRSASGIDHTFTHVIISMTNPKETPNTTQLST
jgi:hypothetical protein